VILAFAIQPLVIIAWIGAHFTFGGELNGFYHAVIMATVGTTLLLTIVGGFPVSWIIFATLCSAIPVAAPLVLCHVCAQLMVHHSLQREESDPWRLLCATMARRWLRTGSAAAAMGVLLAYYWWDTWDAGRILDFNEIVLTDPLRLMHGSTAPVIKGIFLAFALWYGVQFVRTARITLRLRSGEGDEELRAGETAY